jgi:hypothetical protein
MGACARRCRRLLSLLILSAAATYIHSFFLAPANIKSAAGMKLQAAASAPVKTPPRGLYDEAYLLTAARIFSSLKGVQRAGYESIQGDDRRHALPLITGDGFRHMSDAFIERVTMSEEMLGIFHTEGWCEGLGSDVNLTSSEAFVLFVSAEVSSEVFAARCIEKITRPFVLVTHNGDESIPGDGSPLLDLPLLVHWFAQNCDRAHAKLTCIPIGLENRKWGPPHVKGHHGSMPELMMGMLSLFAPVETAAAATARARAAKTLLQSPGNSATPLEHTWAYFDRGTHAKVRDPLWDGILKAREAAQPLRWIRIAGVNGGGNVLPHELYRFMLTIAAMICPRGNGLDTHRMWESLYLGRTTVVTSGTLDPLWKDLPVLILDDWQQVHAPGAEDLVMNTTEAFAARAAHGPPFAVEKLFMMHWLCLIGKAAGRDAEYCGVDAIRETLSGESTRRRRTGKNAE